MRTIAKKALVCPCVAPSTNPVVMMHVCHRRRLREVSDVAQMQVSVMEARQQSRDKETDSLRRQVLDLQVRRWLLGIWCVHTIPQPS